MRRYEDRLVLPSYLLCQTVAWSYLAFLSRACVVICNPVRSKGEKTGKFYSLHLDSEIMGSLRHSTGDDTGNTVSLDAGDVTRWMLQFFKENNLPRSYAALESESQACTRHSSFFRDACCSASPLQYTQQVLWFLTLSTSVRPP